MKKCLKLIFSRFTLICLAILMQLVLYIVFPLVISESFPIVPINIVLSIIALFVVLAIINSDMIIEGQLPLVILCILMPLVGVAFCFLFLKIKIPKKVKKYSEYTFNQFGKNIQLSSDVQKLITTDFKDASGVFNYIYRTTGFVPYKNTNTKFLSCGEDFLDSLLVDLSSAKDYIFMEYFIIERGKMWSQIYSVLQQKVKDGVEVRVVYDDLGTISRLPSNFAKKLRKIGIKCVKFNEYSYTTSSVYNNRDHRKITVIDGKVGYMGGINIADEYINEVHPYGTWKDSAVRLEGSAVDSLVCMFLQLYDIQSKMGEKFDKYIVPHQSESQGLVCPFGDGPKYFYGDYVAENLYINLIGQAKDSVLITTPYLIIDSKLKNALINASKRGVDVKIITPHIPDKRTIFMITRSSYKELQSNGIKIFEYSQGFIHAKQVLVDNEFAVVGTVNFDYRSFVHHYECGVLMYKSACIPDIQADFEQILSTAVDMKDYKQNIFTKLFCAFVKLFTPLF